MKPEGRWLLCFPPTSMMISRRRLPKVCGNLCRPSSPCCIEVHHIQRQQLRVAPRLINGGRQASWDWAGSREGLFCCECHVAVLNLIIAFPTTFLETPIWLSARLIFPVWFVLQALPPTLQKLNKNLPWFIEYWWFSLIRATLYRCCMYPYYHLRNTVHCIKCCNKFVP